MPTKVNGNGNQQEYDASTGRYGSGDGLIKTAEKLGIQIPDRDLTQGDINKIKDEVARRSKNIVELNSDNELARLIASSDDKKYSVIRDYLIANFGGKELDFPDGTKAKIDNSDARELSHKADDKRVAELSAIEKLVAQSNFVNIIDVDHTKFARFKYYSANIKIDGQAESIWLNVGEAKNDKTWHLYAITKKKTAPTD